MTLKTVYGIDNLLGDAIYFTTLTMGMALVPALGPVVAVQLFSENTRPGCGQIRYK